MAVYAQVIEPSEQRWQALEGAAGSKAALDEIRHDVETGKASMIDVHGEAAGTAVVWIEPEHESGPELVIALGAGRGARALIPWIKEFSKQAQAMTVRTHLSRAGLRRLYERNGFTAAGLDDQGYMIMRYTHGRQ